MCDGHVVIITTHPTAHYPLGYFRNVKEHVLSLRTAFAKLQAGMSSIYWEELSRTSLAIGYQNIKT